jgi:hypothetical protein
VPWIFQNWHDASLPYAPAPDYRLACCLPLAVLVHHLPLNDDWRTIYDARAVRADGNGFRFRRPIEPWQIRDLLCVRRAPQREEYDSSQ